MLAARRVALLAAVVLAAALAQGTQLGAAGHTEDEDEAGLVQHTAAIWSKKKPVSPATAGETCKVQSKRCAWKTSKCPCAAGLTCVPKGKSCKGTCLLEDGQPCTCSKDSAGGVCASNMQKQGGLCKTRRGAFTITLTDVSGGIVDENPQLREAFERAAARYAEIIQGQIVLDGDVVLEIFFSVEEIDGPGTVLGFAGPATVAPDNYPTPVEPYGIRWLPISGIMVFDLQDVLSPLFAPLFETIVLHEMAHVIGIGTLQEISVLLPPEFPFTESYDMTDCEKAGDGRYNSLDGSATAAYLLSGGYVPTALPSNFTRARLPPIETDFGPGTMCGHWSEATLGNELMTGFISLDSNPLSIVTIGGLEDLGYVVDYRPADPYTVPLNSAVISLLQSARAAPEGVQIDEHMVSPRLGYTAPGGRGVAQDAASSTLDELNRLRAKYGKKGAAGKSKKGAAGKSR